MREELARRARIARIQAEPFSRLGRFVGPYRGGLFWRYELVPGVDLVALYEQARRRNLLISPGFMFHHEDPATLPAVPWMRVNVSVCEGVTLTRALSVLAELVAAS